MLLEKYEVENGQINLKISYKSKGAIFTNIKKTPSKKNNDILNKISKAKTEKELIEAINAFNSMHPELSLEVEE